jgi:hypothetical protein
VENHSIFPDLDDQEARFRNPVARMQDSHFILVFDDETSFTKKTSNQCDAREGFLERWLDWNIPRFAGQTIRNALNMNRRKGNEA